MNVILNTPFTLKLKRAKDYLNGFDMAKNAYNDNCR